MVKLRTTYIWGNNTTGIVFEKLLVFLCAAKILDESERGVENIEGKKSERILGRKINRPDITRWYFNENEIFER